MKKRNPIICYSDFIDTVRTELPMIFFQHDHHKNSINWMQLKEIIPDKVVKEIKESYVINSKYEKAYQLIMEYKDMIIFRSL